ncbi:16S rRNA (uracil(1498)-N(3))-methyltransferase [Aerococcaceae bacterium DSM 109653]|uniref:Ribosomal RNA small subunit methyltransferase E n=1 Tax=Fundicoccus ignavus TaxID=2664442 RepID=A0A844BZA1_9LACT|nr:16S rRNA (uracil(1498)-N(3))-methyltransferase [Fundicoccus ignavus]
MQQYFIDKLEVSLKERVPLSELDSHHFLNVMRAKIGTEIKVVDRKGFAYVAQLVEINEQIALLEIVRSDETISIELPVNVTIACGLSKNDKVDTIVQKATECGMNEFIPLALKRDVVKWTGNKVKAKVDRLAKISKAAAEQSHRLVVPEVSDLQTLDQLIKTADSFDVKLIAYEETAKEGLHSQLAEVFRQLEPSQKVLMVFGSEGGLESKEVEKLEAAGFLACSLGPRILRAETAPIYFLSALSFALELGKV